MPLLKSLWKRLIPFRLSQNASKTLMWMWFYRDSNLSRNRKTSIDVACGPMVNRKFFFSERYIGVDVVKEYLEKGQEKYPEAEFIHSKIEDVKGITGNFVVCLQCMNINCRFDNAQTENAVKSLINMTASDGVLIFNIGSSGRDIREMERNIDGLLGPHFKSIEKRTYGSFSIYFEGAFIVVSVILASIMYIFPFTRNYFGKKYTHIYYVCRR